ncbi:MAG: hypothetical protein KDJ36_16360 [Hyphomicrobiaceae bacterium]|nr:hypothetical protein [Hyphomicrobiaceae bacterium]
MTDSLDPLIFDFLEWLERTPRTYADVLDVWRTSCPRLTVWEDASDRGLVHRRFDPDLGQLICVSEEGRQFLAAYKPDHRAAVAAHA